ncbi:TIM barrel protein [Rhizobium sp. LCM 4573]|uniref:TIM barrel protein n=1 Tax=Rhizobium sp. LCM 4573 TaxID=1848291 RepID=UPI0008DA947E|nr:TIM barrel protein [Rhizobium sp. LCM 4573]OHV79296.1 xylose isomerase [Rhizobium sp. LCM 4573]
MRFAINHITAPKLTLDEFFAMANALSLKEVEIRNDLPDTVGTMRPEAVREAAERAGLTIISINALYPFNVWSGTLPGRAVALADYAAASGAKALVMCPLNEGTAVSSSDLVAALKAMRPILADRGLTGLVEPLGFPVSSLRTKREAIEAIDSAGGDDVYRLVHDTFHHHIAGEAEFFPERTGLVHISGVSDRTVMADEMLDSHRVLVDAKDRLENISQIEALIAGGFKGPYSFEPFAAEIHALANAKAAVRDSMAYIEASI